MAGIEINAGVINYGGVPLAGAGLLASRPAFGVTGRLYIGTDTNALYRDTGSAWVTISAGISGTAATGQATFWSSASTISGDNAFFWDNTNKRLGLGTATPGARLDVHSQGTIIQMNGTGTGNTYIDFQNAGSTLWRMGNTYNGGTRLFQIIDVNTSTQVFSIASNGVIGIYNGNPTAFGNGGLVIGNQGAGQGRSVVINSSADGANGLLQFIDQSGANALQIFGTSTQAGFYGYGSRTFDIYTNGTLRFTMSASGMGTFVNRLNVSNSTDNSNFSLNNANGNLYTGGFSPNFSTYTSGPVTIPTNNTGLVFRTAATITATLPLASGINNQYILVVDTGTTVTLNRLGSDVIINTAGTSVTSLTLIGPTKTMLYCDGGTRFYQLF